MCLNTAIRIFILYELTEENAVLLFVAVLVLLHPTLVECSIL